METGFSTTSSLPSAIFPAPTPVSATSSTILSSSCNFSLASTSVLIVDTEAQLTSVATKLRLEKVLAIDVEALARRQGGDLGMHHGPLALLQICTASGQVYLVDIFTLTASCVGRHLRSIFEHPGILKLFFDVRKDSEALACQLGTLVRNALDLQLCCVCVQWKLNGNCARMGLSGALETHSGLPKTDRFDGLLAAIRARTEDVWDVRPLPPLHIEYACTDVIHLHTLHSLLTASHPQAVLHGQMLTDKYLGFYCTGQLLKTEVDRKPQLVNLQWLRELATHGANAFRWDHLPSSNTRNAKTR